jgi:hypothetical protein
VLAGGEPVTVRITVTEEGAVRRIGLDGRLSAEELAELEHLLEDDPMRVYLDLANLRSADACALALLRRLRREGFEMRRVPPHLAWRIEADSSSER